MYRRSEHLLHNAMYEAVALVGYGQVRVLAILLAQPFAAER